jgi:hypothetical protein
MMVSALSLALFLAASGTGSTPGPAWEKIFETQGAKERISSVWATGPNDWFAGGVMGLARATKDGVERTPTAPRAVLGLLGQAPNSVFAFGDDELVMRFDGKKWTQEHVGSKPKRPGRGADLLYFGFHADAQLAAAGVSLLLVRRADGTWVEPPEPERKRLLDLGQQGPPAPLPMKCDKAGWIWLGKGKGFFRCHDRRSFTVEDGKLTPQGKVPIDCTRGFNALAFGQGELFASCGPGKVWKTHGETWKLFASFKGAKIGALSVTESCVFVGGTRAIWRSCQPTPPIKSAAP